MTPYFDTQTHSFEIEMEGFGILRFRVGAELDGKAIRIGKWKPARAGRGGRNFRAEDRHGSWRLGLKGTRECYKISLSVRLKCRVERAVLTPVLIEGIPANHVLTHGRKMGGCAAYSVRKSTHQPIASEFFVAITSQGHTLQLAHPLQQHDISNMAGEIRGGRVARLAAFTSCHPCGHLLRADPVTLSVARDGHLQLQKWAEAQATGEPPLEDPGETGWNSWDYYRWTVTEEEVLKNAEFIAKDPVLSKHVRRIVVDDGWQYCYGEWEANPRFPSGMKSLAREITRMGFTPGLWLAPVIAEPHAHVAQWDSEMLACGPAGVPCLLFSCMGRNGFLMDPTHPRTAAWWKDIFRRYAGYGFGFFKLDFLGAIFAASRFHDPRVHRGDLMRRIIEPIRGGVGPGVRLLGCNYTFEGGRGLVGEVRVASDIHAIWECVKRNAVAMAARSWAHRRLWINDPDFAIVRGVETSNDPHLTRLKALLPCLSPESTSRLIGSRWDALDGLADFTALEAQTWLSLVIISGGVVNFSDNLPRLNSAGLSLLRKVAAAKRGQAGVALDLFRSELPAHWTQRVTGTLLRTLLVNWSDEERRVPAPGQGFPLRNARNFWTGKPISLKDRGASVVLPPHGCLLIEHE